MDMLEMTYPNAVFTGSDTIVVEAGKSLKIETTPGGEDIYNGTVPRGKEWQVKINLEITEVNL